MTYSWNAWCVHKDSFLVVSLRTGWFKTKARARCASHVLLQQFEFGQQCVKGHTPFSRNLGTLVLPKNTHTHMLHKYTYTHTHTHTHTRSHTHTHTHTASKWASVCVEGFFANAASHRIFSRSHCRITVSHSAWLKPTGQKRATAVLGAAMMPF